MSCAPLAITAPDSDRYGGALARAYGPLATVYSLGAIDACRAWGGRRLQPGSRVLFVGAGTAVDVVDPARRGVRCDVMDSSAAMLERARRRLARTATPARFLHADARSSVPPSAYDAVVSQFFLNTFGVVQLPSVVNTLLAGLRAGGDFIVGDFAPPATGPIARLQRLYHDLPMHCFARWTGSTCHAVHDLPAVVIGQGADVVGEARFRIGGAGPAWYAGWVFRRRTP